ncbi:MAG TPA: hypothetical protein VF771_10675, partial [Longimicrobiaceae bacterium]
VVRALRRAGATSPDAARQLGELGRLDARALGRLVAAGTVHQAAPGRYWLDEAAYAARRGRRMVALGIAAIVLVLAHLLLVFGLVRL